MAKLICVCDEEMCWCTEQVEVPDHETIPAPEVACPECKAGKHVWTMGGPRDG